MKTILICEIQCANFEHSEFNAAFLMKLISTFPDYNFVFFAEEGHIRNVSQKLKNYKDLITYKKISIAPRNLTSFGRMPYDLKVIREVFNYANKERITRIIFSSITTPALFALKYKLFSNCNVKCGVILHSILESIQKCPWSKPWKIPFWFKFPFIHFSLPNLKYIVLGESIKINVLSHNPDMKPFLITVDHPYFMHEPYYHNLEKNVVKFAAVGVGNRNKGTHDFIKIAVTCSSLENKKKPAFWLIGHINDQYVKNRLNNCVKVFSVDTPLNRQQFDNLVKDTDYIVFCYPTDTYKLTASGAMLDAISHLKPIIAIENDFFKYYFDKLGNVGYLCKNIDEIIHVINNILNSNMEEYHIQRENILKNREIFTCDKADHQLKKIFSN